MSAPECPCQQIAASLLPPPCHDGRVPLRAQQPKPAGNKRKTHVVIQKIIIISFAHISSKACNRSAPLSTSAQTSNKSAPLCAYQLKSLQATKVPPPPPLHTSTAT
eukprot:1151901-Pelagomonas_calceolata.AAC.8